MNRKILGILFTVILTISALTSIGLGDHRCLNEMNVSNSSNNYIDIKDQENLWDTTRCGFLDLTRKMEYAQGFIPTHSPLLKLKLHINDRGNPQEITNLKVSIRESLNGYDLASTTINLNDFTSTNVEFAFPETDLTIGNKYYFILSPDEINIVDYGWIFGVNWYDTYEHGDAWFHSFAIGTWEKFLHEGETYDFVFTTHWRDYAPDTPVIDGPIRGNSKRYNDYTFYTNDPEDHDVRYYIDWGDGNYSKWIGLHESGEYAVKSYKWASEGDYTIRAKAKDSYGAKSDWTELEVSMPKTKVYINPFLRFLENYPNLFPLLRQIVRIGNID